MDKATYDKNLKDLQEKHKKEIRDLQVEFALASALYKKGDIIKDSYSTIKVEKIKVSVTFGNPEPVYYGLKLKKDLTPMKKMEYGAIYGNRLVELVKHAE